MNLVYRVYKKCYLLLFPRRTKCIFAFCIWITNFRTYFCEKMVCIYLNIVHNIIYSHFYHFYITFNLIELFFIFYSNIAALINQERFYILWFFISHKFFLIFLKNSFLIEYNVILIIFCFFIPTIFFIFNWRNEFKLIFTW